MNLYVVEDSKGRIKVGISGNPSTRIKSHKYGIGVSRHWISEPVPGRKYESCAHMDLFWFGANRAEGREIFTDITFDEAVKHVATSIRRSRLRDEAKLFDETGEGTPRCFGRTHNSVLQRDRCLKRASVEIEGKHYCKNHIPRRNDYGETTYGRKP